MSETDYLIQNKDRASLRCLFCITDFQQLIGKVRLLYKHDFNLSPR